MSCFFYFYPADIFETSIIEQNSTYNKELTLKQLLGHSPLFTDFESKSLISFSPTLRGWFMLFIIFIGLPIMIAFRTTIKKHPRRAQNN